MWWEIKMHLLNHQQIGNRKMLHKEFLSLQIFTHLGSPHLHPRPPTNSQKRTSSMLVTYLGFPLGSFCAPLVMTVENEKSLSGRLNPKVKAGRQLCHAFHSASHNTYKILVLKHPKWMVISCKVPGPSSVQALKTLL